MGDTAFTKRILRRLLGLTALFLVSGCIEAPVLPEAFSVDELGREIEGAGASLLLPAEYSSFQSCRTRAEARMEKERHRVWPFRAMDQARVDYIVLSRQGSDLLQRTKEMKEERMGAAAAELARWQERIAGRKRLTAQINEGRYAREHLVQAELLLDETASCLGRGDFWRAELLLSQAALQGRRSDAALEPVLARYGDRTQIARWRGWMDETLEENRRGGGLAIIVFKLERRLVVYRGGRPLRTYQVGLGANGLSDKSHSGDDATPEGMYHVSRKNPASHYYKALVIDYPNEEDRRQFALAKHRGLIGASAGIGSLVELHGGGKDSVTYGCVSLDNHGMDELYNLADVGTPVTIVGADQAADLLDAAGDDRVAD
jgi:hypothetical protein